VNTSNDSSSPEFRGVCDKRCVPEQRLYVRRCCSAESTVDAFDRLDGRFMKRAVPLYALASCLFFCWTAGASQVRVCSLLLGAAWRGTVSCRASGI
jgi:hypothetical protein